MVFKNIVIITFLLINLFADEIEDSYGFDDEEDNYEEVYNIEPEKNGKKETHSSLIGILSEEVVYSWLNNSPHNDISSLKSSLFLEYNDIYMDNIKVRINMKSFYDAMYDIRGKKEFTDDEYSELQNEVELYDAYIESSINENLDVKFGRQVVVWGRSDTLRATDILNPIDNRRPGMVDIKDLRLPETMLKFDYFFSNNWRLTPILILEQRFTKTIPFGSVFYPKNYPEFPNDKKYTDPGYALSLSKEFEYLDISLYTSRIRNPDGYVNYDDSSPEVKHEYIDMGGGAINIVKDSWLFKSEFAYIDKLKFTTVPYDLFSSTKFLLGSEYSGPNNTLISYDFMYTKIGNYSTTLKSEPVPVEEDSYQHAFRINSDFKNNTIKLNYLIVVNGEILNEGGYQRAWVEYELRDAINVNIGIVDYLPGSVYYDSISNNDLIFSEITYSF